MDAFRRSSRDYLSFDAQEGQDVFGKELHQEPIQTMDFHKIKLKKRCVKNFLEYRIENFR